MARGQLRIGSPDEQTPQEQVAEALAAFGLVADAQLEIEEPFVLWPENLPVLMLWFSAQTQWQCDPQGYKKGLDYSGVEVVMRMRRIPEAEWEEFFRGLQTMEVAALNEWREQRGRR